MEESSGGRRSLPAAWPRPQPPARGGAPAAAAGPRPSLFPLPSPASLPSLAPEVPSSSRGRSVAVAGTAMPPAATAPGQRWKRAGRRGVRGSDRRHVAGRSSASRWCTAARPQCCVRYIRNKSYSHKRSLFCFPQTKSEPVDGGSGSKVPPAVSAEQV